MDSFWQIDGWGPSCRCRPGAAWQLRHSLWMLAPLLGLGALCWVGFVYVAARTRQPGLVVLAAVFVVAGGIGGFWPFGTPTPTGAAANGMFLIFLWAAAVAAALITNPAYLAWRWRAEGRCRCWLTAATQSPGGPASAPARPWLPLIQGRLPKRPALPDPDAWDGGGRA